MEILFVPITNVWSRLTVRFNSEFFHVMFTFDYNDEIGVLCFYIVTGLVSYNRLNHISSIFRQASCSPRACFSECVILRLHLQAALTCVH